MSSTGKCAFRTYLYHNHACVRAPNCMNIRSVLVQAAWRSYYGSQELSRACSPYKDRGACKDQPERRIPHTCHMQCLGGGRVWKAR